MKPERERTITRVGNLLLVFQICLTACAAPRGSTPSVSSTVTTMPSTTAPSLPPRFYDPPVDLPGPLAPNTQLIGKIFIIPIWCPHPCEIQSQTFQPSYGNIIPPQITGTKVEAESGRSGTYYLKQGDGSKLVADDRDVYREIAYKYKKLDLKQEMEKEKQRVQTIKAKIPAAKRLATQKFVMKVDRIFSSMQDYYITTITSRSGGGILRKDIDRYDDAVVEAKGDVPDEVIAYVEETYRALRKNFGSTNSDDHVISRAKLAAMNIFAE